MRTLIRSGRLLAFSLSFAASLAAAQDAYYDMPLDALEFDGGLPGRTWVLPTALSDGWAEFHARVWIEGGEGYLVVAAPGVDDPTVHLVARAPQGSDLRGTLFLPDLEERELAAHDFSLRAALADPKARAAFLSGVYARMQELQGRDLPGGAWFRHRGDAARRELEALGEVLPVLPPSPVRFWSTREDDLEDTYALFTGGRALSENVQLDRVLANGADEREASISIADIEGITVRELDWKALLEGREPALDPLAALIPADQHALFFASFGALVELLDEVSESGAPILELLEPRSEDSRTIERYQEQMCLPLDELGRALGALAVRRVALTGSDPYFRTGTDVALLFETEHPELLEGFVRAQQAAAAKRTGAESAKGAIAGLEYEGVVARDRSVSSYVARAGSAVLVANSLAALGAIGSVVAGERPALASAPEYAFFRDRYPLGDAKESAFLVLTDATIRRWCGPRWRIGASRRVRAAAVLADLQAEHFEELVRGEVEPKVLRDPLELPGGGALTIDAKGVASATYGTLAFQTPIAELDLEQVTPAERDAYTRFREGYQSNWSTYFDPIGARLFLSASELDLDLSVRPLIAGSDYLEFSNLAGGVALDPQAGDSHPEALLHFIYAIDRKTHSFRQMEDISRMLPSSFASPLAWVGESAEVWIDDDPLWDELDAVGDPDGFFDEHLYDLPIAARIAVRDPLQLAAFLTALRALSGQAAPGLVRWESREYHGEPYVAILAEKERSELIDLGKLGIYYAALPDALVVSLREDVVQRAIDRRAAKRSEGGAPQRPWLGESTAFRIDREGISIATKLFGARYLSEMQQRAWAELPILDEWRRLFPDRDPLELHERFWHVRLTEPGGGRYVWDDALHTMRSTLYGSPGAELGGPPLPAIVNTILSADLGLTFEQDGLRARVVLRRE